MMAAYLSGPQSFGFPSVDSHQSLGPNSSEAQRGVLMNLNAKKSRWTGRRGNIGESSCLVAFVDDDKYGKDEDMLIDRRITMDAGLQ